MIDDGKKRPAGVEVLAPAGSLEGLRAAIGAGADAVYMGGTRFGARAYADNPGQDALCAAIDYVHLHGRRIYLTVNTLLKPEEMGDALYHYLKPYYEQGVDAVIVQDVGVLEFIAQEFPGLPVHASTQMSLTMAEGARCFEGYPVTRLVNARELGLPEIRRIRECSSLEIESFVHGALCYCYSGQCLMSSLIGGRSGNRGRCAQPCRLEYDGTYLFSPKDICTLDMIPELIEAGIDSFKIEGRMKRYEYAAGVTAAYRREVDRYFALGGQGYRKFHRDHPDVLLQTFINMQDLYNRGGFTQGYYCMHNGRAMMSMARPNHSGVLAAKVEKVSGNRALLCCTQELHAQDVLEIRMGMLKDDMANDAHTRERRQTVQAKKITADGREQEEKTYEFTLGQEHAAGERFEAKFTPGLPVKKGDVVYRTKNNQLLEKISEEYFKKEPKVEVLGEFTARVGEAAALSVRLKRQNPAQTPVVKEGENSPAAEDVCVCVQGEVVLRAEKQPMQQERLRASLEKTGDTPFRFSGLEIQTSGEIFIPVSALNALRREALDAFAKKLAEKHHRELPARKTPGDAAFLQNIRDTEESSRKAQAEGVFVPPIHVSVMTEEQLDAVLKVPCARRVYYDLAALPVEGMLRVAKRAREEGKEFFLRLPRICRAETYIFLQEQKDILLDAAVDGYLLQNYEEVFLFAKEWRVQEAGKQLVTDAMLYAMNEQAKRFFRKLGVTECSAPYEENARELRELGIHDMALTVYGRLPLMTSAQCVRKNTQDCQRNRGDCFQHESDSFCGKKSGKMIPIHVTDRKKKKLPVLAFCRFCYNVVYSPECLTLLECDELNDLAPSAYRYDFTIESGEQVRRVLENGCLPEQTACTYGHFRRGVL